MIELTEEQAQIIMDALAQTPIGRAIGILLNAPKKNKEQAEAEA